MKPKTTILMVLAIGCGLAAAFMTNKLIAERNKDTPDVEKVNVVVAKAGIKKIPAMTFIKKVDDFFEIQEKAKNDVPKNALTDLTDSDMKGGFRVSRSIAEGSVLSRDDLISKAMEGLSSQVPPGMRAIATRVTAESLAGGFVLPGSRVDVVWTFRTTNNESGTLTILQDMLVLAVDTQAGRNPENPQTILGATVTLAVKPEEAQKIALASGNGEIRLALRNSGDSDKLRLPGTRPPDLAVQPRDADENKSEGTTSVDTASVPPPSPVPPLPKVDKPTMPDKGDSTKVDTTPVPPVVEKEPVRKVKIHKLVVEDGPNRQEHKFVWDEETQSFDSGGVTRSEVDPKSSK